MYRTKHESTFHHLYGKKRKRKMKVNSGVENMYNKKVESVATGLCRKRLHVYDVFSFYIPFTANLIHKEKS